jgi:hypothetical protein
MKSFGIDRAINNAVEPPKPLLGALRKRAHGINNPLSLAIMRKSERSGELALRLVFDCALDAASVSELE